MSYRIRLICSTLHFLVIPAFAGMPNWVKVPLFERIWYQLWDLPDKCVNSRGTDLYVVQKLLGHSDLKATKKYAFPPITSLLR